ncbi:MAG: flagellar motor switch phosphatase FliY [Gudongella sp.]|nr:flagellar motor switch phosphatase FliY [Gudongella sp.]
MNDNLISQEEIDALLNKNSKKNPEGLNELEKDIIGEVGNISMSTAATTLSSILNKKVMITTPRVYWESFEDVIKDFISPKVVATVEFKKGLSGNNLFMMDTPDAAVIADLMMGGNGKVESSEMTVLQQSAVAEAMNQMIGSASTAMATMVGKEIDINPPIVKVWELDEEYEIPGMDKSSFVCKVEFDITVEGLIESKIMQLFERQTITEIVGIMQSELEEEPKKEAPKEPIRESVSYESKKPEVTKVEENVLVQKPIFNELARSDDESRTPRNLDLIMDVPLEFSVVLGKSKKTIKEILSFGNGSVIELNKQADEALEIYVNGKLIAQGEVVVINENFGIRITNILSKEQRVKGLK